MAEQLSQSDIDALLNTFSAEDEPAPAATGTATAERPAREIRADEYDFSHPDLLSLEQVRAFRAVHAGYAQALGKRLCA